VQLNTKTLDKLREIINGDGTSEYRSGPKLVAFFKELGFDDVYYQGFPSRGAYTDEKLKVINGTPELDKCIRNAFAVYNYIGRVSELDRLIVDFNQYIAFDKWAIVRDNDTITFKKLDKVVIDTGKNKITDMREDDFLKQTFDIKLDALKLEPNVKEVIELRLQETESCVNNNISLASIILIGSILEGVLLSTVSANPQKYNQAQSAPKDKDTGKTKRFPDWTLSNLIDVSFELGLLKQDVKKVSHVVRGFRNYIHPYEQMASRFFPDNHTALICMQVLKAAINQIAMWQKNIQEGQ
jgi:hypothetical protein